MMGALAHDHPATEPQHDESPDRLSAPCLCIMPSSLTSQIVSRFPQGRPRVQATAPDDGWHT